jgi:hypothetical protein
MLLDLNLQLVEMNSMMPRGSSLSTPLPGGETTPHQDRIIPQGERRMKDSRIDCTKDTRTRGNKITRTLYNRLVKLAENSSSSQFCLA